MKAALRMVTDSPTQGSLLLNNAPPDGQTKMKVETLTNVLCCEKLEVASGTPLCAPYELLPNHTSK